MTVKPDLQPLIDHLCHSSELTPVQARRIVDEVIAYLAETPEDYVRRRHRQLKEETGFVNAKIFTQIAAEMEQLAFASPALSQRQMRRIIYG